MAAAHDGAEAPDAESESESELESESDPSPAPAPTPTMQCQLRPSIRCGDSFVQTVELTHTMFSYTEVQQGPIDTIDTIDTIDSAGPTSGGSEQLQSAPLTWTIAGVAANQGDRNRVEGANDAEGPSRRMFCLRFPSIFAIPKGRRDDVVNNYFGKSDSINSKANSNSNGNGGGISINSRDDTNTNGAHPFDTDFIGVPPKACWLQPDSLVVLQS